MVMVGKEECEADYVLDVGRTHDVILCRKH